MHSSCKIFTPVLLSALALAGCGTQQGLMGAADNCCTIQASNLVTPVAALDKLELQPLGTGYLDRRRQVNDRATAEQKIRQVRHQRNQDRIAAQRARSDIAKAFDTHFGGAVDD